MRISDWSSDVCSSDLTAGAGIDDALFWTALGGAILGGLILNLMPCVFPILSLKALSLARAGGEPRPAKVEALAYTAGAIVPSLLLCGALLSLRAAGEQVGWAFSYRKSRVLGTSVSFRLYIVFCLII